MPGFRDLLRHGATASGNGLLTQAPPNTGAGWFTLATGAWPGVHGSTNNTFHINGQPFAQLARRRSTPRRAPGRDARPGRRARRQEGRPDRVGRRPQRRDRRARRSTSATSAPGRGVATNYIAPTDSAAFTAGVRPAVRPPDGFAGQAPFPQAAPAPRPAGPTCRSRFSPAKEMRLRVLDARRRQVRPQRLHLRQPRRPQHALRPRAVLAAPRTATTRSATSREGEWADVKVTIHEPAALDGKTGGFLVKVERLARDLSQVRLFHTSVTRAIATWPTGPASRASPAVRGLRRRALPVLAGRRLRGARGRHRQRGDLRRAGPVLGEPTTR